ncbi:DUF1796 family putative cysteine peptidase [Ochrobactrum sp. MYb379]|uniref:DUF1796 family putative cysteine peptidase n=1 Tax=Ochrobactrum sp. MYb379 TaxID=2745275 RepID=UPI003098DE60
MKYVSLGHACQVAHQLKRLGLSEETLFYDWLVTHHGRLMDSLDFSFKNRLFSEGYTLPQKSNYLIENSTGLSFYPHDFRGLPEKDTKLIDSQIDDVRSKYMRRAERTLEILNSSQQVCVVRHFFSEPLDNIIGQQKEIIDKLGHLYPTTEFQYLWASELETANLNSPHGPIHHLPKANVWQGDDTAWGKAASNETLSYSLNVD